MSLQLNLCLSGLNHKMIERNNCPRDVSLPFIPPAVNMKALLKNHDSSRKDSIKFKHQKHGEHRNLEECASPFSRVNNESYFQNLDTVEAICNKKSYGTLYKGYQGEVTNAQDDLCMHELTKPEEGHWYIASADLAREDQLPHETPSADAKIPKKQKK